MASHSFDRIRECRREPADAQGRVSDRAAHAVGETESRSSQRSWEQCCPVSKFHEAFGPDATLPEEETGRFGTEVIDGLETKVLYFLKDGIVRPHCYDILQQTTSAVQKRTTLAEVASDSEEDMVEALDKKAKAAAEAIADKMKTQKAMSISQ